MRPLKCYFWTPGALAHARQLKMAGVISGSPCLDHEDAVMQQPLGLINPFDPVTYDSWWWKNRKWLGLGAFGLVGAGVLALAGKFLR